MRRKRDDNKLEVIFLFKGSASEAQVAQAVQAAHAAFFQALVDQGVDDPAARGSASTFSPAVRLCPTDEGAGCR